MNFIDNWPSSDIVVTPGGVGGVPAEPGASGISGSAERLRSGMDSPSFDYAVAFSRNIGWVTPDEQQALRNKHVAIAGMGGVGGVHLTTLARLGVGRFSIADQDQFKIENFNRQVGALVSTLGQDKRQTLARMALDINPQLDLRPFPFIDDNNVDAFLDGADLYVDSIDFFAPESRRLLFEACWRKGIPAITAAPLGMGTAVLAFLPGGMSFEDYFGIHRGMPETEMLVRFLAGLAPRLLHGPYLVDPSAINLAQHRGPSTFMGCELAAGVAGTYALKILLHRGPVPAAPRGIHFDAYRNKLVHTWRPGGHRNPLQRLLISLIRRNVRKQTALSAAAATPETAASPTPIEQILDLARWAPSGDNTQPWRFEVLDDRHLAVHAFDTRRDVVYDLQGRASQLSHGILLETIAIAASAQGLRSEACRRADSPEDQPIYDVTLHDDPAVQPSVLLPYLRSRTTQRRPMRHRPLSVREKRALTDAVGADHELVWIEGPARRAMARLLFRSAHIRLTTREAYEVHRKVIEWGVRFSNTGLPDQAIGLDAMTLKMMRWAMASWDRVRMMNRITGTVMPRLMLDYLPGVGCAAHFMIAGKRVPQGIDDYVAAGRAVQRFWLTAAQLGLQFQPEMTPLIFSNYAWHNVPFTSDQPARERAHDVARRLGQIVGADAARRGLFMGRVGEGPPPWSRSLRQPLDALTFRPEAPA